MRCYGLQLKYYPDQDAKESLLPRNILHKLFAVTAIGSAESKSKFNFGDCFLYAEIMKNFLIRY